MNPDGVILGNYRTNFAGKDLNRQFKNTNKSLFPTVFAMKELLQHTKNKYGENLFAFFDLHGHSIKRNVFIYGPEFQANKKEYFLSRFIPKILDQKTEMFRFFSSKFKISPGKMTTARAVCAYDFNITNSYTVEASFGNYMTRNKEVIPFDSQLFRKMVNLFFKSIDVTFLKLKKGSYIGEAICDYNYLINDYETSKKKTEKRGFILFSCFF